MYISVWGLCACECSTCGVQKEVSEVLELELTVVSHLTWVLGTELLTAEPPSCVYE